MNLRDWKLCVSSNVRRSSDRTQFETTSCSAAIPVRIWVRRILSYGKLRKCMIQRGMISEAMEVGVGVGYAQEEVVLKASEHSS
jgi:hypothetical protein